MRRLEQPSDRAVDTYMLCAKSVRNAAKRKRLLSVEADVAAAAKDYVEAATEAALHQIVPSLEVAGTVTKTEMIGLYKNHMARKGATAREVYNRLILDFERVPMGRPDDRFFEVGC